MKRFLLLILFLYSLSPTAQEVYPLQPIERTSFYAEPLDEPIDTELPSGSITARESGANTIGLTTGELSVSGSGAAVYTVPIAVPKGIGGVAPTLALTYNSQSGNGIAGYGWHLAGLSVISRVGSTMYHNGKITEVNLTNTDQFALDGQRLMLKEGIHGESGALYETETFSQLRIKAVGRSKNPAFGPDYFEVLYPDGSKAYYGKDNNSQSPMEYAISYWENAQGVSIRYFYKEEGNCIYIDHIEYGGKGENNLHKVKFLYTYRQLTNVAYVGGVRF
jgi:YD repeat protein|nr:SpvB/TcaC N-terminal domain-containing protein [uncultured Capnocytophaga sp.]